MMDRIMSRIGIGHTIVAAVLLILAGCVSDTGHDSGAIKEIQVEKYFDSPDIDNLSGKIKIEKIFQPQFTDSTMFDVPDLLAITDGKAYMHDGKWFAVFDYDSGKLISAFNRYGAGPEEYKYSHYVYYTPDNGEWTVLDMNIGVYNIMQYSAEGEFVKKTVNDSIQSLSPLKSGGWLAFNVAMSSKGGYHKVRERKVYEYDSDWNLKDITVLKEGRWGEMASALMDEVYMLDGENYITDMDTVYRFDEDTHKFLPRIAIVLGKYLCDWGSLETFEEIQAAQEKYVRVTNPIFNERYAFARYNTGADLRFDIYDLGTGELVYRKSIERENINSADVFYAGVPVEIDGKQVFGWPLEYVENGSFYLIVSSDEMARISDTDEVNPTVVKISVAD